MQYHATRRSACGMVGSTYSNVQWFKGLFFGQAEPNIQMFEVPWTLMSDRPALLLAPVAARRQTCRRSGRPGKYPPQSKPVSA